MYILGINSGGHDAAAGLFKDYAFCAGVQHERLTRIKGAGGYPHASIAEILAIAGIAPADVDVIALARSDIDRKYIAFPHHHKIWDWYSRKIRGKKTISFARIQRTTRTADSHALFRGGLFLKDHGFRPDAQIYFPNHHRAHALSALFYTDWSDALIYTADALGDNVQYSARLLKNGTLSCLFGGEDKLLCAPEYDSVARAYAYATEAIGFRSFRHEGKLTGLAAYGKPVIADPMKALFSIDGQGKICGHFPSNKALRRIIFRLAKDQDKADVAASVQQMLEDLVLDSIERILAKHPVTRLGLAGGVFANVRLNALLKERLALREIFIFPGMGDEGLVVGGPLDYLLQRDGLAPWLERRDRLSHMSFGRDYTDTIDGVLGSHPAVVCEPGDPVERAAEVLAAGQVGAIYTGRMEFGPRALGNRSILASPAVRGINDSLNKRLARTEFMPFAPYVRADDAREVFGVDDANAYACWFMTITTKVAAEWKEKIPAVVHVDGTARPQIITREHNALYYDILTIFKQKTGLPVLVNTSFNAHEEPIIDTPQQCLQALLDDRVDFIVTSQAIYRAHKAT